ncbi:hypothetical protein [Xanthovirga aplysinae]|uniref:hypothetical protein n=1 Tax=Xanthovirga aplysinae TaxID=2529853 RepID=UPI0012BB859D|nr:hypothetical protein [Xanthovirga aplysinae]MTI32384.1 hypothetical protein [Xanthovirga aplysinae]
MKIRVSKIPESKFIPITNFEWRSGLRKNFYAILPIYLLALSLSFFPYVSLLLLWVFSFFLSSFYMECEPLDILLARSEDSAQSFIKEKLREHLQLYIFITFPIVLLYGIFHFGSFWIPLVVYLLSLINICYFILSKYASYEPNMILKANTVLHVMVSFGIFLPFLLPLSLILCIRNYFISIEKLKYYLDA